MNTDDRRSTSPPPDAGRPAEISFDDVTVGPSAHGFGTLDDGREFAFEVRRTALRVEIYRAGRRTPVPDAEDAVAAVEVPTIDVDLDDARSVTALVADALAEARRTESQSGAPHPVRALLGKLGSVFDVI